MSMTFYYLSGSPFSWKVWLALEHLAVPYEQRVLSVDAGDLMSPGFLAINPRGKVPAIVDGDVTLWESAAIIEYLAETYSRPGRKLWPDDGQIRAMARRLAAEVDSYIYPPVRKLVVELLMRRDLPPDLAAIAECKSALSAEFARIERDLTRGFLCDDAPSAADFALYPLTAILMRLHAKAPAHNLGSAMGLNVQTWRSRVESLPYFAKTIPPHWRTS